MKLYRALIALTFVTSFLSAPLVSASAQTAIVTDSRIKTFVYNENEVFNVVTHYGYQSNIEFGSNESIVNISVGDRVGWQITPAGRRLFIRAMEDRAHTNMTVVTNKRAYQFDLREAGMGALLPSEELVYVIRFYYPDEPNQSPPPPLVSTSTMAPAAPTQSASLAAPAAQPVSVAQPPALRPTPQASMNYNYTFSGAGEAAPVKIYDDGQSTYFKFANPSARPSIAVLTTSGQEMPLSATRTGEGLLAVSATASRFMVKTESSRVVVYNESQPGA